MFFLHKGYTSTGLLQDSLEFERCADTQETFILTPSEYQWFKMLLKGNLSVRFQVLY